MLTPNNWTNSQAEAIGLGGNLVTVNSAAENDFVFTTFGPVVLGLVGTPIGNHNISLWIGMNDLAVEGQWEWVSGEPVTYTNWWPGEGVAKTTDEEVGGIYLGGLGGFGLASKWHDISISLQASGFDITYGVVEVVPEPATFTVLALGGMMLTRRHRLRACSPAAS